MDVETRSGRVDLTLRTRPRSEVVAFGKLMAILASMKSRDTLNSFQVEVYEDATVDVPLPVLAKAVQTVATTPGAWRPDVGDLLKACEGVRLEIRDTLKFQPCELCSQAGWVEREFDGVKRMVRCSCWRAHQQRVAALGVGAEPLALPEGMAQTPEGRN